MQSNWPLFGKPLDLSGAGEAICLASERGTKSVQLLNCISTSWNRSILEQQELQNVSAGLTQWKHPAAILPTDFEPLPEYGYYVVYPWTGRCLLTHLIGGTNPPWTLKQALLLLQPFANLLDVGHRAGRLHLDLSPTKVVLGRSLGQMALVDFGLHHAIRSQETDRDMTLDRGRWSFWATEVWRRQRLAPATDQFALASIVKLLLTGRPLVDNSSAIEAQYRIEKCLPDLLEDLPEVWRAPFLRALSNNPADRYASCREFAAALAGLPETAEPGAPVKDDAESTNAEAIVNPDDDFEIIADFTVADVPEAKAIVTDSVTSPPASDIGVDGSPQHPNMRDEHLAHDHSQSPNKLPEPIRRRRTLLTSLAQFLIVILLVSTPAAAYWWTNLVRPRVVINPTVAVANPQSPPIISDAQILARLQSLDGQLAELQSAGLPTVAPDLWKKDKEALEVARNHANGFRLKEFVTTSDDAEQAMARHKQLCLDKAAFDLALATAKSQLEQDDGSDFGLVKRWDTASWQEAIAILTSAKELADRKEFSVGTTRLGEIGPLLARRVDFAKRRAAAATTNPGEIVALLHAAVASGSATVDESQRFSDALREDPAWLLIESQSGLSGCSDADAVFGYCELAAAFHSLNDERFHACLEEARLRLERISPPENRLEPAERLLSVAADIGDKATGRAVLHSLTALDELPVEATGWLLGYSLVFDDAQSWRTLGQSLATSGQSNWAIPIEAMSTVGKHTGDFTPVLDLFDNLDPTQAPMAKFGVLLAIAERGDAKQLESTIQRLNKEQFRYSVEDAMAFSAYCRASRSLATKTNAGTDAVEGFPALHQDFIRLYDAIGVSLHGSVDAARELITLVPKENAFSVRPVRGVTRRWLQSDSADLVEFTQWTAGLRTPAEKTTALAWAYATLQSKSSMPINPKPQAKPLPRESVAWRGMIVGGESRPSRSRGNDNDAGLDVCLFSGSGTASFGGKLLGQVPFATVKQSERSLRLSGTPALSSNTDRPHQLSLSIFPSDHWAGTFCFVHEPERIADSNWGVAVLGPPQPLDKEQRLALQSERAAAYFQWLISVPGSKQVMLWPQSFTLQIVGKGKQRALVAETVDEFNKFLPEGYRIRVDRRVLDESKWRGGRPEPGFLILHLAPVQRHRQLAKGFYGIDGWPAAKASQSYILRTSKDGILNAVAMVDDSIASEVQLKQLVTRELLRCLGLGWNGEFPGAMDSVLVASTGEHSSNQAALSKLDASLLRYAYVNCSHGQQIELAVDTFRQSLQASSASSNHDEINPNNNESAASL